jgi:hypothetical protein
MTAAARAKKRSLYLRVRRFLRAAGGRRSARLSTGCLDPAHPVPYRLRPIEPTYARQGLVMSAGGGPAIRAPTAGRSGLGNGAVRGCCRQHDRRPPAGTIRSTATYRETTDVHLEATRLHKRVISYGSGEVLRGRFRGLETPEPIAPGAVTEHTIARPTTTPSRRVITSWFRCRARGFR